MNDMIIWGPLLPLPWFILLICLLIGGGIGLYLWAGSRHISLLIRYLAISCLISFFILSPSHTNIQKTPLPDISVLFIDDSFSTFPDNQQAQFQQARNNILEKLKTLHPINDLPNAPNIGANHPQLQIFYLSDFVDRSSGTAYWQAYQKMLLKLPLDQIRAVFLLSDGQIDDPPTDLQQRLAHLWMTGSHKPIPPHHILNLSNQKKSPILRWESRPDFKLKGEEAYFSLSYQCPDNSDCPASISVDFLVNGQKIAQPDLKNGTDYQLTHIFEKTGQFLIQVQPQPDLETPKSQSAMSIPPLFHDINILQDQLRVLMISGPPHMSSKLWRRLLRADPNIDLIHFTVLRPQHKVDATPARDLSLIHFPIQDLFETHLDDFDFIIWDRYQDQNTIPPHYLARLAAYVKKGGGLLYIPYIAPQNLADIAPSQPRLQQAFPEILPSLAQDMALGPAHYKPFQPKITEMGLKHPITATLAQNFPAGWGKWYRHYPMILSKNSQNLMSAHQDPLLSLSYPGQGRIAQLNSDQIWVWARGIGGEGPALSLLHNLTLWLMQDHRMADQKLNFTVKNQQLSLQYQALTETPRPVQVTLPDGRTQSHHISPNNPLAFPLREQGYYIAQASPLFSWYHYQRAPAQEMQPAISPSNFWQDLSDITGGSYHMWHDQAQITLYPHQPPAARAAQIGLEVLKRQATEISEKSLSPLIPPWLWILLFLALSVSLWSTQARLRL